MKISRDDLIDRAGALFRAKGYAGASIDDIAQACGVTKGSLYHHFDGKEALALAAMQRVHRHFADHIFSLIVSADWPGIVELAAFNRAVEDFFGRHPQGCLLANLSLEAGAAAGLFEAPIRAYFADWRACYARVLAGRVPPDQAREMAEDWLAIVQGCLLMLRIEPASQSLRRQHRSFEALLG